MFFSLVWLLLWLMIRRVQGMRARGPLFEATDSVIFIAALGLPILHALSSLPIESVIYAREGIDATVGFAWSAYEVAWLALIIWWGVIIIAGLTVVQSLVHAMRK